MIRKVALFGVLTAILCLAAAAYAQDLSRPVNFVGDIGNAGIPNDTIVVISTEETGIPGYFHVKYALVDQDCPGNAEIVDYYGSAIDPKDSNLRTFEKSMCTTLQFNLSDGD
jgi:hypothetical protein